MVAASISLTDEVIQEVGEQISLVVINRTKFGRTKFGQAGGLDLMSGVAMYQSHMKTAGNLRSVRQTKSGDENKSERQISGKSFEILDVHDRRSSGEKAYTTDELAGLPEKERKTLFQKHPGLEEYAKTNHPQTDVVELKLDGTFQKIQHKALKDPTKYYKEFEKDSDNEKFVVPSDKYDEVKKDLDSRIEKGGEEGKKALKIKEGLEKGPITYDQTKRPRATHIKKLTEDAGNRVSENVRMGIVCDIAVFTFGGVVVEIREAYEKPHAMPLMERCRRLLLAILEKLRLSFKDHGLREIGSEIILGLTTALLTPIKRARGAIKKIVETLRKLWMDFVNGKIKSLGQLVSAVLMAIFAVASVGVALALEQWLSPMMAAIPGGDIIAAIIAAALAGVIIVVSNRSIKAVVQSLASLFREGAAARLRREEIQSICDGFIPQLIEDRNQLERIMEANFSEQGKILNLSFKQLQTSQLLEDIDGFLQELAKINAVYGSSLPWRNFQQFDQKMQDPDKTVII